MAKAKQPKAVRPPLFDRIFKPKTLIVGDHSVLKPRSRALLIWVVLIAAIIGSVKITGFDLSIIVKRGYQFTVILAKIFNPKWGYFEKVIPPLLDTIKMSVMGSVIGSTLALPFAVLSSANINRNGAVVALLRVLLNIVRTLPTLVIASICALIFNLGTFAGTVAITIFTFGIVSKMLYESIETIDMGAFDAMEALGASKFQAFWSACFPQILPTYLSHCLYSFEINVRAASILGYVGAGGLGILINERIGWRDYEGLGMVLIALFVVVLIIENTSQFLRRKLS
jgi:phosphonate transport system permease protein